MHSFLKAIGFSKVENRTDLDRILGQVMDSPTEKKNYQTSTKQLYTEFRKDFAENMGVAIRGEYDELGFFHLEHYFPYFTGTMITAKEDVSINKRVDTDAYTGMCDDYKLGISLMFYLQNSVDYLNSKSRYNASRSVPVTLSALSTHGKILLGLEKTEKAARKSLSDFKMRTQLIAEAKAGNQDAIDSLTIDEMDLYASVTRRIRTEDLYSIVETSFIPYGSESDNYSILGTILNWKLVTNTFSGEQVYQILVNCNDLVYSVCINKENLLGEPMIGRRFKGNIWMQGKVDFSEL